MKLTKLSSALLVFTAVSVLSLPVSNAYAAADPAKIAERKARKSQAVGEKTGKAIAKAYELYSANQADQALAILMEQNPSNTFDKAFLNKFIGQLMAEKQPKKALTYLQNAIKDDVLSFNDQGNTMKLVADLNLMEKNYQKAIDSYRAWMDFTGDEDSGVYLRIANAYYELKKFNDVIPAADKAITLAKKPDKQAYQMKFVAYYEQKQIKKAIEVLEVMVSVFPDDKPSWVYLGQFYAQDERFDRALAVYDLAYKQGWLTKESEIKVLANLYVNNNVPYRAAAVLEKHLKAGLLKKDRSILNMLASAYSSAREFSKSAEYFGVLAQQENDAEAYRKQGNALLMADKNADAVTALQKALELGVKDKGRVHLDLISAYFLQGKLREAYRHVQLASQNGQEKTARGWSSYIQDRAKKKGIQL